MRGDMTLPLSYAREGFDATKCRDLVLGLSQAWVRPDSEGGKLGTDWGTQDFGTCED